MLPDLTLIPPTLSRVADFFLMLRLRSALSEISSFVFFRKLELGH